MMAGDIVNGVVTVVLTNGMVHEGKLSLIGYTTWNQGNLPSSMLHTQV